MHARSDSVVKLIPALIAARAAMPALVKDAQNPHFRSRYADLASCLETCQPALAKNGIALVQATRLTDGMLILETTLAHVSGEWLSAEYPVTNDFTKPQLTGAALTYARRYSLMSVVGLGPEDDDGETASGRGNNGAVGAGLKPAPTRPAPPAAPRNGTNGNGAHKPPAAAPAPAPAPAPATPASLLAVRQFAVISGPGLRSWAREIERGYGPGIADHIAQRAAKLGVAGQLVALDPEQVEDAHLDAQDSLELVYGGYRDEPAADGDFPAGAGSRFD